MNDTAAMDVTIRRCEALDWRPRATNLAAVAFYEKLGYVLEERASFGQRRKDGA